MAGGIAATIGGMLGLKGSAALAFMASGMTSMQQSAAQRAGAMASPEGRAQMLSSQEMAGATLTNHPEYGAGRYMDQMAADQRRRMEAYKRGEEYFGSGRALSDAGATADFVSTVKGVAYATAAEKHLGGVTGRQSDQALKEAAAYDAVSVLANKHGWSREETMKRLALGNVGSVGLNASEAPGGKAGVYTFGMDGDGNVIWSSGKAGASVSTDNSTTERAGNSKLTDNSTTERAGNSKSTDNTTSYKDGTSIQHVDENITKVDKGLREKIGADIRHGDTTLVGDSHTYKSESRGRMDSGDAAMALREQGVSGGLAVHAKGGDVTFIKDPATGQAVSATMDNGTSVQSYNIAEGLMTEKGAFRFKDPRTGQTITAQGDMVHDRNGTVIHGDLRYSHSGFEVHQTLGTGGVETTISAMKGSKKEVVHSYREKQEYDVQQSAASAYQGGAEGIYDMDKNVRLNETVGIANYAVDFIKGLGGVAGTARGIAGKK